MATRLKTVEYRFDTNKTGLALATRLDLAAIDLFLEKQSRTFRSVMVRVEFEGQETVATSLTSILVGIKLGAVAFTDATFSATFTNSGNQTSLVHTQDVTSYFTTNYGTAVKQTCQVGLQFGALATINHSVTLVITYEFDDTELLDSGTAESGGASTITDTNKAWTTDQWIDHYVKTTGGTGSGQVRLITANTATQLTVDTAWGTQPDATTTYQILQQKFKTVRIPIEGNTTALSTTLASIGSSQIPNLDTFLPEANKYYKDKTFEIMGKDGNSGTTDFSLAVALDAEAEVNMGTIEKALNGGQWHSYNWKRNDMTTNATHDLKARSNAVATRFMGVCAILNVTYGYSETESTTIMNSLMMGMSTPSVWLGGTASGNRDRIVKEFWVEEGTVTLRQSAVLLTFGHLGATTTAIQVGAQSARSTAHINSNTEIGQSCVMQRFDSGGAAGSGHTLSRGKNTLQVDMYVSNALDGCPSGLFAILNYTSAKASGGVETHNKSILYFNARGTALSNRFTMSAKAPGIPETDYYLNAIAGVVYADFLGSASGRINLSLRAERLAGDTPAEGWEEVGIFSSTVDGELGEFWTVFTMADLFKSHPTDPRARMDLESARQYYLESTLSFIPHMAWLFTYHSITFDVAGTVSGYGGAGTGIEVEVFRTDNGEKVGEATTTSGGAYTFTWYDDTVELFTTAREDDTHVGRSPNSVAS